MKRIGIVEVGLRDGLQNEATVVPTAQKVTLLEQLVAAGLSRIEAVSFVHPRLVPAMADAEAVMALAPRRPGVSYAGLVLNERGFERALAAEMDEINLVVCASDTFNRRNQNASRDETLSQVLALTRRAREAQLFATVTIAVAFGCPFEGEVDPQTVISIAREAIGAGAQEICLADTIGVGVPPQVTTLGRAVRALPGPDISLRFHFHNTRNTGYANAVAALEAGADVLYASIGGLGGCPFAPKATGNIATEDLIYLLDRMSVGHPGELSALLPLTGTVSSAVGHPTSSLVARAGPFPRTPA